MAPTSRYRSPGDMPREIPVFPLRGVILLPRADLPLNVFEPRYLTMVDEAIAGNRLIGIVQPEQTSTPIESPAGKKVALKRIGCAGRITAFQELRDGRLQISLTGIARFTIAREVETAAPYRAAEVNYADYEGDFLGDGSIDRVDRDALLAVLKSYLESRRLNIDWSAVNKAPLEPLINGLSAMSPFTPEEKQALLEAKDVAARAAVLTTLAEMAIASHGNPGTTLQ